MYVPKENANLPPQRLIRSLFYKNPTLRTKKSPSSANQPLTLTLQAIQQEKEAEWEMPYFSLIVQNLQPIYTHSKKTSCYAIKLITKTKGPEE